MRAYVKCVIKRWSNNVHLGETVARPFSSAIVLFLTIDKKVPGFQYDLPRCCTSRL